MKCCNKGITFYYLFNCTAPFCNFLLDSISDIISDIVSDIISDIVSDIISDIISDTVIKLLKISTFNHYLNTAKMLGNCRNW